MHDLPGTTRDTVDTVVDTEHGPIRFIDTAGMRRRTKVDAGTEYFSIVRALSAIDKADIALLVVDATEGITHQDQRLAERVDAAGCPVLVVLNKWELLDAEQREKVTFEVGRQLAFLGDSVVLKISALSGKGVGKLLPALAGVVDAYHRRVPTRRVNEVIARAQAGATCAARRPGPLRNPGQRRPTDVHALHQPRAAPHLPPLPRTKPPRGVRHGADAHQAAGATQDFMRETT